MRFIVSYYKVDNYYSPENDRGIAFNDPELAIDWQLDDKNMKLSEKDTKQPLLADAQVFDINDRMYGG